MRRGPVSCVVGLLLGAGLAGCGGSELPQPAGDPGRVIEAGEWRPIAASPLGRRDSPAYVWTGSELLVLGGAADYRCPDGADCAGPLAEQLQRDGAAYDPETDTWRPVAAAPEPIWLADVVWTGEEAVLRGAGWDRMVGFGSQFLLAYDPVADSWRRLPDSPEPVSGRPVWSGTEIVYVAGESAPNPEIGLSGTDWALDPATGTWRSLPPGPYGPAFDRSFTWTGDRFLVTELLVGDDPDKTYRLSSYDPVGDTWTPLDPTPVGFWDPTWWYVDGRLVNVSQDAVHGPARSDLPSPGGQLDVAGGQWSSVPQHPDADLVREGCQLPALGPAGDWIVGGGLLLVSLDPPATLRIEACGDLPRPTAGAWTGSELIVYGGFGADAQPLDAGFRWTPPAP